LLVLVRRHYPHYAAQAAKDPARDRELGASTTAGATRTCSRAFPRSAMPRRTWAGSRPPTS
jgi:hypothetical protein